MLQKVRTIFPYVVTSCDFLAISQKKKKKKNDKKMRLSFACLLPRVWNWFQCQMNGVDVFRSRFYVAVISFRKLSNMLFFCSNQRCAYINRYIHSNPSKPFFTRLNRKTTRIADVKHHRRRDTDDRTANKWQINFGRQFNWAGSD